MVKWFRSLFSKEKRPAGQAFDERHSFIEEQEALSIPWAMFEIVGFEENGRMKVEFNWNKPFIKKLDEFGFTAETEEDTVQLFFYTSMARPEMLQDEEAVRAEGTPRLSQRS